MAAVLAHQKSRSGSALGVFAPAFPATGRTTVDGRVRVEGRALEEAEVWRRDHSYPNADLVDVLATAGIRGVKVKLATIRGGDLRAEVFEVGAARETGSRSVMPRPTTTCI